MIITKHVNSHSESNTYILSVNNSNTAWIVDPGDYEFILDWMNKNSKIPIGFLITHSHIDHIYGINDVRNYYPDVKVYLSEQCINGVLSSKLNLSYYHENPYIVNNFNLISVSPNEVISLWSGIDAIVYDTPGHNKESFSYKIETNLFTGDALIPKVRVYTKFFGGNRDEATNTIHMILNKFSPETIVRPGHGEDCKLNECKIVL